MSVGRDGSSTGGLCSRGPTLPTTLPRRQTPLETVSPSPSRKHHELKEASEKQKTGTLKRTNERYFDMIQLVENKISDLNVISFSLYPLS